jgi:hypothetical protein
MKGQPKHTRVVRELAARASSDVQIVTVAGPIEPGSSPVVRLGTVWNPFPFDAAKVAEAIDFRTGSVCFCDSTLFIGETDDRIWDVLLKHKRVALIPHILKELQWWLADPDGNNQRARAQVNAHIAGDTSTDIRTIDDLAVSSDTVNYYIYLLGVRKHMFGIARQKLERELGRPPTTQEVSNEVKDAGTSRAQLVGRQGEAAKVRDHLLHDETLVVVALIHAITTGEEVTIITGDEAVLDQFCKLVNLVSWHYIAMCFADDYLANPTAYKSEVVDNPDDRTFVGDQIRIIHKPCTLPLDCLPRKHTSVLIHCMLLKAQVSRVTFNADRQIKWLLGVKARTNGLNNDRLEEKNCHLFLTQTSRDKLGDVAAIVDDLAIPVGSRAMTMAALDVELALLSNEQTKPVKFVDLSTTLSAKS